MNNDGWSITRAMMAFAFKRLRTGEQTRRGLFDVVIVAASETRYFSTSSPIIEVADGGLGRLQPVVGELEEGRCYHGGHAGLVENHLGLKGEDILYVGDHIFSDVNVSKKMHRWRTALVVRELEDDLDALEHFKPKQAELSVLMEQKEKLEHRFSEARLCLQRREQGYGPSTEETDEELREIIREMRRRLADVDGRIGPLAAEASRLSNARWGLLMRAGNDKSHLARQVEKSADVYMTRVSNLLDQTPFVYLRSPRGSLPHDFGPTGGPEGV